MRVSLGAVGRAALAAAALWLAGCGGPFIVVEVVSELEVPAEVDALHLVVVDPEAADRSLVNERIELAADEAFPVTILLEPVDGTPEGELLFRVRGLAASGPVATGEARKAWRRDRDNRVTVVLAADP